MNRLSPDERLERAQELGILVDPQDEWLLSALTWRLSTKGYVESTHYEGEWRKTVKLHHYIMGTPVRADSFIDHRNRNKLDNRRHNLRWVDEHTSSQNRSFVDEAPNIRVTYAGKYEVRVQRNGKLQQVGTFATLEEAEQAREAHFENQV